MAQLTDRGAVVVTGPDGLKLLQGLVTNDLSHLAEGTAVHAGLLSPQGKILFEFLVVKANGELLLDVARDRAEDLIKRLNLYKLRADVRISHAGDRFIIIAGWGGATPAATPGAVSYQDPRHPALGWRMVTAGAGLGGTSSEAAYHAHRVALGVPEGGRDYDFGDDYPHEADFDLFHGVSFTKGCYVGQEIVARMQHKTVVRKRVVRVEADEALPGGRPHVLAGEVTIGRLGTVAGPHGLALLRLDRVAEFEAKGIALTAGGVGVRISAADRNLVAEAAREATT
jgi:folate-binding protein YgfZ